MSENETVLDTKDESHARCGMSSVTGGAEFYGNFETVFLKCPKLN